MTDLKRMIQFALDGCVEEYTTEAKKDVPFLTTLDYFSGKIQAFREVLFWMEKEKGREA